MLGVRQLDLVDLATQVLDHRQGSLEDLRDAALHALGVVGEVAGDAEAQPLAGRVRVGQLHPALDPHRGRVVPVTPLHQPPSSSAASVTVRVSGPHWSSEEAKATIP